MENQRNHIAVWEECLKIIQTNLPPQQFETWFMPVKAVDLSGSTLTLEVPTDYYRSYIESAFLDLLCKTLRRVLGPEAKLMYRVSPVQGEKFLTVSAAEGLPVTNKPISVSTFMPSGNPSPIVYTGLKRLQIDPRLNPSYRFSNLIEGECNKLGITAGIEICSKPGKTPFNPLFIFGGPGLGKTHLAHAIGNKIRENNPDLVILCVTGNEFKTQYMDAVNVRNKLTDFLAFYMKIDVLIVDDIQDLVGRGNQNAFFNIFNYLHQNNKQLILTSDRPPKDLSNFEERLLSRFKWGLSVELTQPDYNTRLSMLRSRCLQEGLTVGEDVLEYIAINVTANFRELEGALISMIANATFAHKEINVALAESIIDKIVSDVKKEITIPQVQDIVCEYFNVTQEDIRSSSRKRQLVQARQIAMYLCRNMVSGCSLSDIGNALGGRDHSTVLHSCSTVQDLMSTDRLFKKYVQDIENLLARAE